MKKRKRVGILGGTVAIFVSTFVFLEWVFPYAAQLIVGYSVPLPMPRTLVIWSMVLVTITLAVYVASNTKATEEFFAPLRAAVRREGPRWQSIVLRVAAVSVPPIIGLWVFFSALPRTAPPATTRQQHPGTSGPSAAPYVGLSNPFRGLTADDRDAALSAGRALYFRDCAPCHGAKHDGEGPAARAQSLRPVSFRDPGTIATLVEDAVFWRVNEGAAGLPPVSTPWDSAMPAWHDDLTADEMWQIILSEYDDADVEPRVRGMQ
ncbi:MAG: cytochrome c [Deltaproteobacteria bacterium]|nr:cytochrome c [Deltaproteobacteria bacterium]